MNVGRLSFQTLTAEIHLTREEVGRLMKCGVQHTSQHARLAVSPNGFIRQASKEFAQNPRVEFAKITVTSYQVETILELLANAQEDAFTEVLRGKTRSILSLINDAITRANQQYAEAVA